MKGKGASRREFLRKAAQGSALAATAGLPWGYLLAQQAQAAPRSLRPPGARPGADFGSACIKCGQCVQACPYDTLHLAAAGDEAPLGTPFYLARQTPCYMCPDIPCVAACPTGALDPGLETIEDAEMGVAVIDTESCLSWQGLRCEVCHRECPLQGEAIRLEHRRRLRSKHAMLLPVVNSEACTGCGICEAQCPTEKAAIKVLPPELVKGRIGEHYRLGWDNDAGITQQYQPHSGEVERPDTQAPIDYLNEAGR